MAVEARVAYEHAVTDDGFTRTLNLAGSPQAFAVTGMGGGNGRLAVGFSAAAQLSDTATITGRYDGAFGDGLNQHAISAKIGFAF